MSRREEVVYGRRIIEQTYLWILLILLYTLFWLLWFIRLPRAKVLGNWTGFHLSFMVTDEYRCTSFTDEYLYQYDLYCFHYYGFYFVGSIAAIGILFNLRAPGSARIYQYDSYILNGDIITGISLFLLFCFFGSNTGFTVVLAHILFVRLMWCWCTSPSGNRWIPNLYEAALDLGTTPMQALESDYSWDTSGYESAVSCWHWLSRSMIFAVTVFYHR